MTDIHINIQRYLSMEVCRKTFD